MAVQVLPCELATISIVSLLYGVFLTLFCASTYLVVKRQSVLNANKAGGKPVWRTMPFFGGILLFLTITPHWILTVYRSFMAFIYFQGDPNVPVPMALQYYGNLADTSNVAGTAFTLLVPLIGDALMIYRLWIIWNHNIYAIIAPTLVFGGGVAAGIGAVYSESRYSIESAMFTQTIQDWVTGACVSTLFTNLYCCVLISWNLWRKVHLSDDKRVAGVNVLSVLAVFVESAALYVIWTIIYVGVYESGSNVQMVLGEALTPITGIAFMLINVRVGFGYTTQTSTPKPSDWTPPTLRSHTMSSATTCASYPHVIHITHSTEKPVEANTPADMHYMSDRKEGDLYGQESIV